VVGRTEFHTGGEEEWTKSTPEVMETPYQRVELEGVAHHSGTWVAAGTTHDGLGRSSPSVWYSDDGTNWQRAHPLVPERHASVLSMAATDTGFVVTGQNPRNGRAVIWTSPNGRRWSRVLDSELQWPAQG